MAVREIIKYPNEILTIPTQDVTPEDIGSPMIAGLIEDLVDTCEDAGGAGLAANQIGVNKSVFVYHVEGDNYGLFINPKIVKKFGGTQHWKGEGCLSLPGSFYKVKRSKGVIIEYTNSKGELNTFKSTQKKVSQRIQHEIDHLMGITLAQKGKLIR